MAGNRPPGTGNLLQDFLVAVGEWAAGLPRVVATALLEGVRGIVVMALMLVVVALFLTVAVVTGEGLVLLAVPLVFGGAALLSSRVR